MTHISVIIPCFNASQWIGETLQSVFDQELQDLEVLVIDDGSTDHSADFVKKNFPNVRIIQTPHVGPSKARNIGTRSSSGVFLQYLDADDLLGSGKISRQIKTLEEKEADIVYGDWQELSESSSNIFKLGRIVSRKLGNDPSAELLTDFWCPPAVYLFRRAIVEKIGGWNGTLPMVEDVRLVVDCALQGARFIYCPGVAAYHRAHADQFSRSQPSVFARCCYQNATEIEAHWLAQQDLTDARRQTLLKAYHYVARSSFEIDKDLFESACNALERLEPCYIPESTSLFAWVSRMLGYRRTEHVAFFYRRMKRFLSRIFRFLS